MEIQERAVEYYATATRVPFSEWRKAISDKRARATLDARVARLRAGNFGNCRHVGDGVWESKIAIGPGLRIYYGITNRNVILMLLGGDKGSQGNDIEIAKTYWNEHKNRERT